MAKVGVYKSKNVYGEYTATLDRGELQLQVIAPTAADRNKLVKACVAVLKYIDK